MFQVIDGKDKIRICGNVKTTVNKYIFIDKYLLYTIDDIFSVLQGRETFTKLGLSQAYMQLPIDKNCRGLLTTVIHKSLFQYMGRTPEERMEN